MALFRTKVPRISSNHMVFTWKTWCIFLRIFFTSECFCFSSASVRRRQTFHVLNWINTLCWFVCLGYSDSIESHANYLYRLSDCWKNWINCRSMKYRRWLQISYQRFCCLFFKFNFRRFDDWVESCSTQLNDSWSSISFYLVWLSPSATILD